MIPELHIAKLDPGIYEVRVLFGGQEITASTIHTLISDALRHVGDEFPREWAAYIDVQYVDVSLGTQSLDLLQTGAEVMADRLVALAADVWGGEQAAHSAPNGGSLFMTNTAAA